MKRAFLILVLGIFLQACTQNDEPRPVASENLINSAQRLGQVLEVIEVEAYTYVRISEHGKEEWLASSPSWVSPGEYVVFSGGGLMKDFYSKELDRTFDYILFVPSLTVIDSEEGQQMTQANLEAIGLAPPVDTQDVVENVQPAMVKPTEGTIAVADLYSPSKPEADALIKVAGRVEKVSPNILKTNWVTISDGTGTAPDNKLVLTTQQLPEIGKIYTFEGKVLYDQYIGPGYTYKVLIANATFKES